MERGQSIPIEFTQQQVKRPDTNEMISKITLSPSEIIDDPVALQKATNWAAETVYAYHVNIVGLPKEDAEKNREHSRTELGNSYNKIHGASNEQNSTRSERRNFRENKELATSRIERALLTASELWNGLADEARQGIIGLIEEPPKIEAVTVFERSYSSSD